MAKKLVFNPISSSFDYIDVSTDVTLDANADAFLSLSTQELGVDSQAANKFLASPSTGVGVMAPRVMTTTDLPSLAGLAITYEDTEALVVASVKPAGSFAYATDTHYVFKSLGAGNWEVFALPLGTVSNLTDVGTIQYHQDWGYGQKDLADKNLHNVVMKDFVQNIVQLENGAFRFNATALTFEGYISGAWKTVITLTTAQVNDWMLQSYWRTLSNQAAATMDTYRNVMTLGVIDVGAIPADVVLDGGS